MKLAYISPLSPLRTGISDFSEHLLPYLAGRYDIKLFTDGYFPSPTPTLQKFPAADISEFVAGPLPFDAVLYHMGNHYRYHRRIFEALWRVPGIVILHDCVLNQFFAKYALERGNFGIFRKLFELCYPGRAAAEATLFCDAKGDPFHFPMAGVVAMCSRGIIVMNNYGRDIVVKEAPEARVLKINFPHFETKKASESVAILRKKFNVPINSFVVTSIGHMTPAKRIDVALEGFRKFQEKFSDSVFLLAGEASARLPVARIIERGSLKNVRYLGYLQRDELDGLMEISDVCINLRYPSKGEMSSTLIDMLSRGKVAVVSNYAQFAEFPDTMCIKINLGPNESEDLAGALLRLALDGEQSRRLGEAARNYIIRNHMPDAVADVIVTFIEDSSKVEPLLTPEGLSGLLAPDPLLRRLTQMLAYNMKRLSLYSHEHGVAETLRVVLSRASDIAV